jgi:DNA-binding response OmpR family regulator
MAESIRTLVVDDDEGIRFFLKEALQREGHVVVAAKHGEEALEKLRDTSFDLAILDLKLGGQTDGLRLLEAIRWRWPETVVIILTGHGTLESAMAAIREGVDRYLTKPVKVDELQKAVTEALRRKETMMERIQEEEQEEDQAEILHKRPFEIDLTKHIAHRGGEKLDLTPSEFDLLTHLLQNAHRVVPPPELVEVVRDYRPETLQEARQIIKWYIHRLRQKVEPEPSNPRYVVNVRGVGYRYGE